MLARFAKWFPAALALAGFAIPGAPCSAQTPTLQLRAVITSSGGAVPNGNVVARDNTAAGVTVQAGAAPFFNSTGPTTTADINNVLGTLTLGVAGDPNAPLVIAVPGGTFQVFQSTSVSNAQDPNGMNFNPSVLTSNALAVVNNSPNAVTVNLRISDVGFGTGIPVPASFTFTASASGLITPIAGNTTSTVTGASVQAFAWFDAANVLGAQTTTVQNTGVLAPAAGAVLFSYNETVPPALLLTSDTLGHSETLGLNFTLPAFTQLLGRQDAVFDFGTAAGIPEIDPGSSASALACLVSGVLVLAGRRRKRLQA